MKKTILSITLILTTLLLLNFTYNLKSNKNNKRINIESNKNMSYKKLDSGLAYEITKEGNPDGKIAKKGDKVVVHYTGYLDSNGNLGKKFDSSLDRKVPFSFILGAGHVIQGWDIGVENMAIGEKRRLFIPSTLGYGPFGAGQVIPPNANLIFDVELLNIL